jgi:hypothetical protein
MFLRITCTRDSSSHDSSLCAINQREWHAEHRRAMPHTWIDLRPPSSCRASCAWCVALLLALQLPVWFAIHLVNNRASERESTSAPHTRCTVTGYLSRNNAPSSTLRARTTDSGRKYVTSAEPLPSSMRSSHLPVYGSFLTSPHLLLNAATSSSVTCSDHDAVDDGGGTDGRPVIMIVAISGLAVDGALLYAPSSASD